MLYVIRLYNNKTRIYYILYIIYLTHKIKTQLSVHDKDMGMNIRGCNLKSMRIYISGTCS